MVFSGFCQYFKVLDMKSTFSIQFPRTTTTHHACHTVTENRAFTFSNSKKWYFQNSEYIKTIENKSDILPEVGRSKCRDLGGTNHDAAF